MITWNRLHHHHHHVLWVVQISIASLMIRPYRPSASGRSSRLHPVSVLGCCRYVLVSSQTLALPCEVAHWRTTLMGSSLPLQQCPKFLVRLIWMVFEMGDKWLYSRCFDECCLQDLFNTARSILVQLPSTFFSIRLLSVQVVHPFRSVDTTAALKKIAFHFIG